MIPKPAPLDDKVYHAIREAWTRELKEAQERALRLGSMLRHLDLTWHALNATEPESPRNGE